jgi:hypothetical protein
VLYICKRDQLDPDASRHRLRKAASLGAGGNILPAANAMTFGIDGQA